MTKTDETDFWLSGIDLDTVFEMLRDNGVTEILYKVLPSNANSKNQVYLAKDLSQLGKIPSGEVTAHQSVSEKSGKQEAVFRASLDFYWLDRHGHPHRAPNAQLILYPQYPEVRLSGLLLGCKNAPTSLWVKEKRGTEPDRIIIFGMGNGQKVIGLTLPPESPASKKIRAGEPYEAYGALNILPMPGQKRGEGFLELMQALCAIHRRSWVPSTRLDRGGRFVPCKGPNCHGNTLESLLGICSNGYSLPDFHGWEVKARQVNSIDLPNSSIVTLFTPEPASGFYKEAGIVDFIHRYGYPDTQGRVDRLNFGGVYRAQGPAHDRTGLRLVLDGFDPETNKYESAGSIQLLDREDRLAAAWPFTKLMDHWKIKHAQAAFVPSEKNNSEDRQYRFGRHILLGEGAEFLLLLKAVHAGKVYYDPGIKLEDVSSAKPIAKKRSQFRVNSKDLHSLYVSSRIVDACIEASS